ncbi:MAG: hypothetical protein JXA60_03205 [Candidatus Coatesbacteria bacterium]|nr:hypothetical protein [Candidatus Coatesbacteria bacterium]
MSKRIKCVNCQRTIRLAEADKCPYCGEEYTKEQIEALPEDGDFQEAIEEEKPNESKGISVLFLNPYFIGTLALLMIVFITLKGISSCSKKEPEEKMISENANVSIFDRLTGRQNKAHQEQRNAFIMDQHKKALEDLNQIQTLLELHYKKYGNYPRKLSDKLEELTELGEVEPLLRRFDENKILSYKHFTSPDGQLEQYALQVSVKPDKRIFTVTFDHKKGEEKPEVKKDSTNTISKKEDTKKEDTKKEETKEESKTTVPDKETKENSDSTKENEDSSSTKSNVFPGKKKRAKIKM